MADTERRRGERADLDGLARIERHQRVVGELVLLDLVAEQAACQGRGVDRHAGELGQDVGQAADVVLVGVGDQERLDHVAAVLEVCDVGHDEVDAEHLLLGEHQAAVDDHDLVAVLEDGHVLADLADAAEWQDAQDLLVSLTVRSLIRTAPAVARWPRHEAVATTVAGLDATSHLRRAPSGSGLRGLVGTARSRARPGALRRLPGPYLLPAGSAMSAVPRGRTRRGARARCDQHLGQADHVDQHRFLEAAAGAARRRGGTWRRSLRPVRRSRDRPDRAVPCTAEMRAPGMNVWRE